MDDPSIDASRSCPLKRVAERVSDTRTQIFLPDKMSESYKRSRMSVEGARVESGKLWSFMTLKSSRPRWMRSPA
jgi:hypothetical protein